jgi:fructokinase
MPPGAPIVALGELLWDLLPTGRQAGGAVFNFAFHCHQLGHSAVIVSRIGDDDLGRALRAEVRRLGMTDEFIQTDPGHPTGTVNVEIAANGQPAFTVADDVAWDYVAWGPGLERLADSARAVCYGTLAQRRPGTRETIRQFLDRAPRTVLRVCDINLRPPFVSDEVISSSVDLADWLKMGADESLIVLQSLALAPAEIQADDFWAVIQAGLNGVRTGIVCITCGADGCMLVTDSDPITLPGYRVAVADTVGCGDAFTAALLTHHLNGKPLADAARFANAYAAVVASKPGGTPRVELAEVELLL